MRDAQAPSSGPCLVASASQVSLDLCCSASVGWDYLWNFLVGLWDADGTLSRTKTGTKDGKPRGIVRMHLCIAGITTCWAEHTRATTRGVCDQSFFRCHCSLRMGPTMKSPAGQTTSRSGYSSTWGRMEWGRPKETSIVGKSEWTAPIMLRLS